MNRWMFFFLGVASCSSVVVASVTADILYLGFGGTNYARLWTDTSGRIGFQSLVNGGSTGLDGWVTSGTRPTVDSLSEITLHRTNEWQDNGVMERFNISAMATADGAAYRFGVERGGGGDFKPMIFCFENVTPGVAKCQMKITLDGTFVSDDGGTTWRKI